MERFARRRNPYKINMGQHNQASHIGESDKSRPETSRLEVDRLHDFPFETTLSKISTTPSDLTARYTAFTS